MDLLNTRISSNRGIAGWYLMAQGSLKDWRKLTRRLWQIGFFFRRTH